MVKAFRTYKGIKIYREYEEFPNLKEMKDGSIKELKPTKELLGYKWKDGYPNDSLEECKDAIDWVIKRNVEVGGLTGKAFIEFMNKGD